MKSPMWLIEALLRDSAVQCRVPSHLIERDLLTIRRRVESEGLSFLTITLPAFGSDFLRSLDLGRYPETAFLGFSRTSRRAGSPPAFLQGFFGLVFDAQGSLLDKPDVTAIACLHQICNTFKKVSLKCTEAREDSALLQYVKTDQAIPDEIGYDANLIGESQEGLKGPTLRQVHQVFDLIFRQALLVIDRKIYDGEPLDGRHGPGTTAEKVTGNRKYSVATWHARYDGLFHEDHYLRAFEGSDLPWTGNRPLATGSEVTQEEHELPVRVICVPKTQKGPRIIAAEPVVVQYLQQALLGELTREVMATPVGRSLNFNDQSRNGSAALMGSSSGDIATLDLKEASDRVPYWLVRRLFSSYPSLWRALDATRSRVASVPLPRATGDRLDLEKSSLSEEKQRKVFSARGKRASYATDHAAQVVCGRGTSTCQQPPRPGSATRPLREGEAAESAGGDRGVHARRKSYRLTLRKFASMGSAVCFPVEAMVFLAITLTSVMHSKGEPVIKNGRVNPLLEQLFGTVLVFGDDIVVPKDSAPAVTVGLEGFNLLVNKSKSFWTGKFRESCGTDAYDGHRITPAYCRNVVWGDSKSLDWLSSWVELSNQLYMSGFWETSRTIRKRIHDCGFRIPMATDASAAVAYHNVRRTHDIGRWNSYLHRWEIRAHTFRASYKDDQIDGLAALRKALTRRKMDEDPFHMVRTTRSASVNTKKRWVAP